MQGVPFDLRRAALVALDQEAPGLATEREGGGVIARNAGDHHLGRVDERHDVVLRAPARGQPGERQRRPDERHHVATRHALGQLAGALGELALDLAEELRVAVELAPAPVIRSAHRWHPEQVTGGWTGRSCWSRAASAARSFGGVHFMFVTSATGRRFGPGLRWQSRHHDMLSGWVCITTSISSIRPWQVTHPMPAATWTWCAK